MKLQRITLEIENGVLKSVRDENGPLVFYSDVIPLLSRYDKLVEALTECRWRLAAHQPVTGPHPNDVKALDMAETILGDIEGEEK